MLTRDSAIGYLSRVTVAPLTSSIRGVPSEVAVGPDDGLKQPSAVNLHNVLTIEKRHFGRRVARLDAAGQGFVDAEGITSTFCGTKGRSRQRLAQPLGVTVAAWSSARGPVLRVLP